MNKRLRKKKRIGEFQELCSEVTIHAQPGVDAGVLMWRFVCEAIEPNALRFGGGGGGTGPIEGFVELGRRASAATNRETVRTWLASDPQIASFEIGELRDANYGWD